MSSIFSIFCGTTFSSIFHFFKKQYQCLQKLTKHYSSATVEEKLRRYQVSPKYKRSRYRKKQELILFSWHPPFENTEMILSR